MTLKHRENGGIKDISVDTYQALLKIAPEYIGMLIDEEGNLTLTKDTLYAVTEARINDLAQKQKTALLELVPKYKSEAAALEDLKGKIEDTTLAQIDLNDQLLREASITDPSLYDELMNRFNAIDQWRDAAKAGIGKGGLSSSSKSSGSKKTTEPYLAEIEQTKLLEARLQKVNELLTQNDKLFNSSESDKDKQTELLQKRIELLEEQKSLLNQINETNRSIISNNIQGLSDYGIKIKYTPEINLIEFEQSPEEIQEILNKIKIGSVEDTNEVIKELEAMLDTITKMNEANDKNSSQWLDVQQTIRQINSDLINIEYNDFISNTANKLSVLDTQLNLLGDNKLDEKIEIITKQLDLQNAAVERDHEQLRILQKALMDGTITSEQFKEQTDQVNKSLQESALSAKQYSDSINQIKLDQLNQQKSAITSIVDLVKQMIQQEVKELNDADNDRIKLLKDQNDSLKEQLSREKEIASEKKKALDNELDQYKAIIDAKKRSLDLTKEERYYEQQLNEKTLSITKIQDRLAEIANNDSLSAQAERAKLQEELAQRQLELDNFLLDSNLDKQKEALDSEYERFKSTKDYEKELIERNLKAYEDSINEEIELHDKLSKKISDDIKERSDSIANNGELVRMAMERIDKEGTALYQKLVNWNHIYGTGLEGDVLATWEEYLSVVDTGNKTTLEYTRTVMQDILSLTREIADAQSQLNYFSGTTGIRKFFKDSGYDDSLIGWNPDTGQFSVGDNWYDSSDYVNVDDHLQATWQQLEELLRDLNSFDSGGYIKTNQIAKIHAGERVLRPLETTDLHTLLPQMSTIQNTILAELTNKTAIAKASVSSPTPVQITQHNTLKVDGIATDQVAKDLDKKFVSFGSDIVRKVNTAVKGLGSSPTIRAY